MIEADQLSWRRWHDLRESVLSALLERLRPLDTADPTPAHLAPAGHARDTTAPIPGSSGGPTATATLDARQFQAVEAVQTHRLVLLQGGPGTGKTSTVARMLAAVLERDPATRVQLAAPTGKAAA
ncbi:MAG: AAA family ATPase, partial [Cyanobium sp.]